MNTRYDARRCLLYKTAVHCISSVTGGGKISPQTSDKSNDQTKACIPLTNVHLSVNIHKNMEKECACCVPWKHNLIALCTSLFRVVNLTVSIMCTDRKWSAEVRSAVCAIVHSTCFHSKWQPPVKKISLPVQNVVQWQELHRKMRILNSVCLLRSQKIIGQCAANTLSVFMFKPNICLPRSQSTWPEQITNMFGIFRQCVNIAWLAKSTQIFAAQQTMSFSAFIG